MKRFKHWFLSLQLLFVALFLSSCGGGDKFSVLESITRVFQTAVAPTYVTNPQNGWWWNASEGGSGYAIEVQGNQIFLAAFMYEPGGNAAWYVSTLTSQIDNTYFGTLSRYQGGQTLLGFYQSPTSTAIGSVTLAFTSTNAGSLQFIPSSGGAGRTISLSRFPISTPNAFAPANAGFESGWWWNADQGGRGFFIEVQGSQAFVGGFMYDDKGQPTWYVSWATVANGAVVSGPLLPYTNGQSLYGPWKSPTQGASVGTLRFDLTATNAGSMTLPNGSTVTLSRFMFGSFNGSTGNNSQCQICVESGYVGNFSDGGGVGDGGGDGAAGDGGIFLNTVVKVDFANGTSLGQALTDPVKGMVTLRGARNGQPVKITFIGGNGSQYFDEARGKLIDFPAGDSMTVVVPSLTKNVGATAFTEAAYQYLIAKYGANGWKYPEHVVEANSMVQNEIGRALRDSLAVPDITRLTIVYRGANTGVVDTSNNGIYSLVNSGFAFAAGEYNSSVTNPAAEARKQLAQDLTDGVIDGYTSTGQYVVGAAGQTYDPINLRDRWLQGSNRLAQAYGSAEAKAATFQPVRITQAMSRFDANGQGVVCPANSTDSFPGQYYLDSAGAVTVKFASSCGLAKTVRTVDLPGPTSQMFEGLNDVYFLQSDGRLFVMGSNSNGTLGVNDRLPRYVPTLVSGISNISSLSASQSDVMAITSSGATYAWGGYNTRILGYSPATVFTPELVSNLPRAAMVATACGVNAVLGVDGRVYTFGRFNNAGLYGDGSDTTNSGRFTPLALASLVDAVAIASPQVGLSAFGSDCRFLAVQRDGKVLAWGDNSKDLLGSGSASASPKYFLSPAPVQGLPAIAVRQIGATVAQGSYAILSDGSIWAWGSLAAGGPSTATTRKAFSSGVTGFKALTPGVGGVALTNDGRLFDFIGNTVLTIPPNTP
jgi:hypothetical protein